MEVAVNNLRFLRDEMGLTQAEVAKAVDISRPFYNQLENGVRMPSLQVASRLARFFAVPIEDIFLTSNIALGNENQDKFASA